MNPDIRTIAVTHLTAKQYAAFELIHIHGYSARSAALQLRIHRSTFLDRYDAACLNLSRHGIEFTADGRPYLNGDGE